MPDIRLQKASLLAVCVAHFLMPFMMSAVGIALPVIGRELQASALQLGLVETVYVLAASIFLLAMGRLGDIHGRRRIFLAGLLIFSAFGGLIALSPSIETLILLRFFQGMGGSMVMATTFAIVVTVFPPERRGRALGIAVAAVYAGISCGPFFGGWLVSLAGWRSLFLLCVPLGLAAFAVARIHLTEEWAGSRGEPFDWQGSLIYASSIMLLIVGAAHLNRGWPAGLAVAAGLCGVGGFLVFEGRVPYPVLDVRLLRHNRVFAFSNLAALLNYAATFGVTFFLSLFLQVVRGMTPHQAGTVLILQPLAQALLSPLCGRLADRYSAPTVATFGMLLCAVGLGLAAGLDAASSLGRILALLAALGVGFALFSSPNISVIMGSVDRRHLGVASGLNSTMRTLGMMTSMTVITVVFSLLMHGQPVSATTVPDFLASMRTSLLVFSGLSVSGIFLSAVRIRPAAADSTPKTD
ncbi:EmrB/QacA subfamily drug resistance transporter [Geothermobacter ehrlichii]|uniref:EmrB/QacA subfamily drug resistance transporter n=1 Tax=Geothermobacter ehrlichii TaxID=213224 RepID=A0A5D3WHY3_9BACT|nr:MFS transporter [Geothermobacter ehrlichii]TYO97466.1 EmrB/QacA subfamily drug resistance transporter [Geothermobacter ehrlichii]